MPSAILSINKSEKQLEECLYSESSENVKHVATWRLRAWVYSRKGYLTKEEESISKKGRWVEITRVVGNGRDTV